MMYGVVILDELDSNGRQVSVGAVWSAMVTHDTLVFNRTDGTVQGYPMRRVKEFYTWEDKDYVDEDEDDTE